MNWIIEKQDTAAEKVRAELAKPLADDRYMQGGDDTFDPWALFPYLYGSYSKAFDDMALGVLRHLQFAAEDRYDAIIWQQETLAHEMFREMLCTADLCDYGSSPRVCFATEAFKDILPALIAKWQDYSAMYWAEDKDTDHG